MHTIHTPEINTIADDGKQGKFEIAPLHRGFGVTMGNSLRRVLLSSLEGGAVTAFKIPGVTHEFTSVNGVKEDVVQITLNLKKLRFRVFSDEPQTVEINKKSKGRVTAADIKTTADIEVVDPKQLIATFEGGKSAFAMELRIEKGRGYIPVEERSKDETEVGMIAIDALFSPVERVRYKVSPTRMGQVTGLDKLTLDITTDGSISPTEALQRAATIFMSQLSVIAGDSAPALITENAHEGEGEEPDALDFSVEDLNLSPRTTNALMNNQVNTVRDLVQVSDNELRNLKGFGNKAFNEVISKLKELELR